MADNVTLAQGQLVVATEEDSGGIQHQKMVLEFMSGPDWPTPAGTTTPLPVKDDAQIELLTAMLIEMRVQNEMLYAYMNTEVEPLELLRDKYKNFPVAL